MTINPMNGRTVVITGGNSGIGLETAVGLASAGARVVLGCRDHAKADRAVVDIRTRSGNDAVESRPLDLSDLGSVRSFGQGLSDLDRIDVLINNAGLIQDHRRSTTQGFEAMFGINHLGHFLLTNTVLDQLRAAPAGRVVCVASVAHAVALGGITWGNLDRHSGFNPWRVYGESKLANILHAQGLARRLDGSRIVAHSIHPGNVRSNFGAEGDTAGAMSRLIRLGDHVLISPEAGARTSIHVASSPEAGASSGRYWVRCRPTRTAPWTTDAGAADQLWETSERMIAAAS